HDIARNPNMPGFQLSNLLKSSLDNNESKTPGCRQTDSNAGSTRSLRHISDHVDSGSASVI
ncbi:MAG: hypothetical protein VX237_09125, partial [Chloroflexota bacterium]|nr:hypothetical protein [Chloroflexota bacterium]